MPKEHVVSVDPFKPLAEEPRTGHNRWHEAIEPVVEVTSSCPSPSIHSLKPNALSAQPSNSADVSSPAPSSARQG